MAQKVRMPDGVLVSFPDDISREEIAALIAEKFPEETAQWERAALLPMETNKTTGERRLAWPQIAVDAADALMAPGKAINGEYGLEIDEATGRPTPITKDMIGDAAGLAGMTMLSEGVAPVQAAAAAMDTGIPRVVRRGLRDSGIPASEVPDRMAAIGPDAIPADLAPRLQKQAQAIATMPGPGQKRMIDVLTERQAGRNRRIINDVDETLGPAPVPSELIAGIRANMDALGPRYEEVLAGPRVRAVQTQEIAGMLDAQAVNLRGDGQKAAQRVRQMLNVTDNPDQLDPSPYTLFQTRQAIDGMMQGETNTKVIAVLSQARRAIDAELADKVPGIKDVDGQFSELARQEEALGTGQRLLDGGRTAVRPEELARMMAGDAIPQGTAIGPSAVPFRLAQGNRAEIERLIGTTANDLNALKTALKGDGSWNRDRLVELYGPRKADDLLKILERESTYAATEGDALAGSRTAVLKAAQDEITGTSAARKPGIIANTLNFKFGSAAARLGDYTLGTVGNQFRKSSNAAAADYLSSKAGPGLVPPPSAPSAYGLAAGPQIGSNTLVRGLPSVTLRSFLLRAEGADHGNTLSRLM